MIVSTLNLVFLFFVCMNGNLLSIDVMALTCITWLMTLRQLSLVLDKSINVLEVKLKGNIRSPELHTPMSPSLLSFLPSLLLLKNNHLNRDSNSWKSCLILIITRELFIAKNVNEIEITAK